MGSDPGQLSERQADEELGKCYETTVLENTEKQVAFCDSLSRTGIDTCFIEQRLDKSLCENMDDLYFFEINISTNKNLPKLSFDDAKSLKRQIAKKAYFSCIAKSNLTVLYWIVVRDRRNSSSETFLFTDTKRNETMKNLGIK